MFKPTNESERNLYVAFPQQKMIKPTDVKIWKQPESFLDIDIIYGEGYIKLSQPGFIEKLLQIAEMQDANPRMSIPEMEFTIETEISEAEEQYMKRIKYRQVIGSLLWLSITTRPTISKFVSVASQYLIRPRKQHWKHVQSILRHLKATRNAGLVYRASNDNQLTCFTDADWAIDQWSIIKAYQLTFELLKHS